MTGFLRQLITIGKPNIAPGFKSLSKKLFLSYGVTRAEKSGGGPFFSRTVPSAGGLIPDISTSLYDIWKVLRQVCITVI
jgi:hypothetical protein